MSSYTEQQEHALWTDDYEPEACDDLQVIIDYLNGDEFRSFGEGLSLVICGKYPEKKVYSALDILKEICKNKNIDISEIGSVNALKGWFNQSGERPKKGDKDRQKMFVLAFALGLTVEETKYLFNKVFLDRAFNFRNANEFVYYFCLKNGRSYNDAQMLISQIDLSRSDSSDSTIYTAALVSGASQNDDGELINYIRNHPHNFGVNNISAKAKRDVLIKRAIEDIKTECQYEGFQDSALYRVRDGQKTSEIKDITFNEAFEHITGQTMDKPAGTSSIFKNAVLPKEIKVSFPEAAILSKKEPTSDELRKLIIMLFSYSFWCRMQYGNFQKGIACADVCYDDYIEQLDFLLVGLGFSPMYPGNPHDWLYCYCTTAKAPLSTYRELLGVALYGDTD